MHFTDVTEVQSSFSLMGWTKEWMLGSSADLQKVEPGTPYNWKYIFIRIQLLKTLKGGNEIVGKEGWKKLVNKHLKNVSNNKQGENNFTRTHRALDELWPWEHFCFVVLTSAFYLWKIQYNFFKIKIKILLCPIPVWKFMRELIL